MQLDFYPYLYHQLTHAFARPGYEEQHNRRVQRCLEQWRRQALAERSIEHIYAVFDEHEWSGCSVSCPTHKTAAKTQLDFLDGETAYRTAEPITNGLLDIKVELSAATLKALRSEA